MAARLPKIGRTHIGEVERGKRNFSFLALVRFAMDIKKSFPLRTSERPQGGPSETSARMVAPMAHRPS
jgi:hypothetical protein